VSGSDHNDIEVFVHWPGYNLLCKKSVSCEIPVLFREETA
jgi:hypothetical protein